MEAFSIAGVEFKKGRVGPAATPLCDSREKIQALRFSKAAFIMLKTATLESRPGNKGRVYYEGDNFTVNCLGLPNKGVDFFVSALQFLGYIDKPVIASVATFSIDNAIKIIKAYEKSGFVDLIELNISCPNTESKLIAGYEVEVLDSLLSGVMNAGLTIPIGLKLPPYFYDPMLNSICDVIVKYPIAFITAINTIGNAYAVGGDLQSVLTGNGGFGGMGGAAVRPIALSNVIKLRGALGSDMPIFGVGGVESLDHVNALISVGANLIQVGSHANTNGVSVFDELNVI